MYKSLLTFHCSQQATLNNKYVPKVKQNVYFRYFPKKFCLKHIQKKYVLLQVNARYTFNIFKESTISNE